MPQDMTYQEWYGKFVEGKKSVAKRAKAVTIDTSSKGDGAQGVQYIGKIDKSIYSCITPDMRTDDVIITDNQLKHILSHHPDSYQSAVQGLKQTLADPDYIFADKHPNSGLVIRRNESSAGNVQIVLRICTGDDDPTYKNSVISAWEISDRRLENYLRHKKVLYKRE